MVKNNFLKYVVNFFMFILKKTFFLNCEIINLYWELYITKQKKIIKKQMDSKYSRAPINILKFLILASLIILIALVIVNIIDAHKVNNEISNILITKLPLKITKLNSNVMAGRSSDSNIENSNDFTQTKLSGLKFPVTTDNILSNTDFSDINDSINDMDTNNNINDIKYDTPDTHILLDKLNDLSEELLTNNYCTLYYKNNEKHKQKLCYKYGLEKLNEMFDTFKKVGNFNDINKIGEFDKKFQYCETKYNDNSYYIYNHINCLYTLITGTPSSFSDIMSIYETSVHVNENIPKIINSYFNIIGDYKHADVLTKLLVKE